MECSGRMSLAFGESCDGKSCWLDMMHAIRIMKLGPYDKTKVPRFTEPGPRHPQTRGG
jgi:hypothetical protein